MPSNEVSMVMSQDDIFQVSTSFGHEIPIEKVIVGGVNDIGLAMGLDIVSEDSKHFGFELGNIKALFFKFRDKLNVGSHQSEDVSLKSIGNIL